MTHSDFINEPSVFSMESEMTYFHDNESLKEPVPFEDFKFSLNTSPEFLATPDLGDFPPPINTSESLFQSFDFSTTNTVLNENDHKAFSTFLDSIFLDPNMQPEIQNSFPIKQEEEEEIIEERRRSSILQSLDEQKKLNQKLNIMVTLPKISHSLSLSNGPITNNKLTQSQESLNKTIIPDDSASKMPQTIYLRSSDSIISPYIFHHNHSSPLKSTMSSSTSVSSSSSNTDSTVSQSYTKKRTSSVSSNEPVNRPIKKVRNKELLTEDEKRANHIASEQKRRCTIRNGFKDLTDLIPTLKNINNSKSTVLFKAVDYIRYLERRNKSLREKIDSLDLRIQVEDRMTQHTTSSNRLVQNHETTSLLEKPLPPSSLLDDSHYIKQETNILPSFIHPPSPKLQERSLLNKELPATARNALLAHKTQQKQLLLLQEQLQKHQKIIAQQQEIKDKSIRQHKQKSLYLSNFMHGQYDSSLLMDLEDNTISAP